MKNDVSTSSCWFYFDVWNDTECIKNLSHISFMTHDPFSQMSPALKGVVITVFLMRTLTAFNNFIFQIKCNKTLSKKKTYTNNLKKKHALVFPDLLNSSPQSDFWRLKRNQLDALNSVQTLFNNAFMKFHLMPPLQEHLQRRY